MAKNRRPRKAHRPLAYQVNPLAMLRDHSKATLSLAQLRDLMIAVHLSLKAIEDGQGREEDVIQLAVASNVALILAEAGLGREHIPDVKEAQRHIVRLQELWNQWGRVDMDGDAKDAIVRMLELHDEQIAHPDCTEDKMRAALRLIHARMVAGHVEVPA